MSLWQSLKSYFKTPSQKVLITPFDTPQRRGRFVAEVINNVLENPDTVLAAHAGAEGVELYRKMERTDPVIASAMTTRRAAVIHCGYTICENGSPAAVGRFVNELLGGIEDFTVVLEQALEALTTGFVPLEVFWTSAAGKWWIEKIVPRDPAHYVFDGDGGLRLLTAHEPLEGRPVPPLKFIVHRHHGGRGNPYGRSVLQPLYWAVTFSRAGWKWWSWAVQKYGMPIITASFPPNAGSEESSRFTEFVKSLQAHAWAAVPDGFEIDLHEARRPTADDYLPFLEYADTKKYQVILGQNLTAEVARTGSRAQAVVHNEVRHDITFADCMQLASTVNHQLIRPAVRLNFNYDGPLPTFQIPCKPPQDLEKLARTYAILAQLMPIGEQHLRSTFDIPPLGPNERAIQRTA